MSQVKTQYSLNFQFEVTTDNIEVAKIYRILAIACHDSHHSHMQVISVVMKMIHCQVIFHLLTLLLLCSIASFQVTQNPQQKLYIKRSTSSQCPFDIQITVRQTLDWYSEHFNASFISKFNTKMLFEEGRHKLKNTITIDNGHNFIMIGNGSVEHSNNGLPQPTSQIYCDKASSAGLFFSNSSNISIKNLELKFCSGQNTHSSWSNMAASLIFDSVQNVSLDQVVISSAKGHALYTKDIFGSNYVVESAFLNSSRHQTFSQSGNARFNFGT